MSSHIYVVALEDNCYYLGVSSDCLSEFNLMMSGKGPEWTRLHKPITIKEIISKPKGDINFYIRQYTEKYGADKVKGEDVGCDSWHCGPCGKPFKKYEDVKEHLYMCPKVKLEVCPRCEKVAKWNS